MQLTLHTTVSMQGPLILGPHMTAIRQQYKYLLVKLLWPITRNFNPAAVCVLICSQSIWLGSASFIRVCYWLKQSIFTSYPNKVYSMYIVGGIQLSPLMPFCLYPSQRFTVQEYCPPLGCRRRAPEHDQVPCPTVWNASV